MPTEVWHVEESRFDLAYEAYSIAPADSSEILNDLLFALGRFPGAKPAQSRGNEGL
jgi:hypothetical protein